MTQKFVLRPVIFTFRGEKEKKKSQLILNYQSEIIYHSRCEVVILFYFAFIVISSIFMAGHTLHYTLLTVNHLVPKGRIWKPLSGNNPIKTIKKNKHILPYLFMSVYYG